jgi:Rrf2 family transcriptional regulator, iron-sulfur cluster assembly transcription factor
MTVIFSKKCEYGIQAVLYLSVLGKGVVVSALDVSGKLNIPKEFIAKILQDLRKSKIIKSKKGNSGGFYLAKEPSAIKMIDIVKSIDGLSVFDECVLGFTNCSSEHPCPVHKKWGKLRDSAFKMLSNETLADLKAKSIRKIKSLT